jgi:hypothetical protein
LTEHHDYTFENAYCWSGDGNWPEYCGAWGEAYDVGPCEVICGAYWLTTIYYLEQTASIYVWEGGVSAEPGAVLYVASGILFDNIPIWPEVGQSDVAIGLVVSGEFTVGYWGNWGPGTLEAWFTAVDYDGSLGRPWTYVAPDLGLPTGWQNPDVLFPPVTSLGIGLYYGDVPVPAEAPTWGALKALFR